jgi:hypothetical protein
VGDWNPYRGERIGPAWTAVVANLSSRSFGSDRVCVDIACRASGISRVAANRLIDDAVRHGYLAAERVESTNGQSFRRLHLTDAGLVLGASK